ncbi:MAG TPA: S9 family peptidase, partial [Marinilabiliales bacterium]|nr:S9 family peptidase [Marinilabiliales bacterium]
MNRILATFLLGLISLPVFTQTPEKQKVTLSDLYKTYTFYPRTIRGLVSMNDGVHYTALSGDSAIFKFSYKTGEKVAEIVSLKELNMDRITSLKNYEFNSDESKLIFYINREDIYRRSFTAEF